MRICKKEDILISVKIITYNHEKYIAKALDSVLMQKVNFNYEIVVGEDCSTDSTKNILLEYKNKYPNIIKLILHDNNVGMIQNSLIVNNTCRGTYIAILEGDDYWIDQNKLQVQIDQMRKYQDCDISFHSSIDVFEDKSKKNTVTCRHAKENKIFTTNEVILEEGGFCPTSSLIVKSEVLKNLPNWFDEVPVADYFVQILGSVKGGALYIDRTMSIFRRNTPGSWTLSVKNINKQEKNLKKYQHSLDKLDLFLGNKFSREINMKKSKKYFTLAKLYLRQNRFQEFNDAIVLSHMVYKTKSITRYLYFYFKSYPIILLFITKPSLIFKRLKK